MEKERIGKITDSEWQIMELIWAEAEKERENWAENMLQSKEDAGKEKSRLGLTQPAIMMSLGNKWNKNTVHTFLKRLCDKGYLEIEEGSSPHKYVALVSREACEREERQSFLERVYQGSAERMVAAFIRDGGLEKAEADKLRRLLEEVK